MDRIPAPPDPPAAEYPPSATTDAHDRFLFKAALTGIALFIALFLLINIIAEVGSKFNSNPCGRPQSFACLDQRVNECMASEKYTKEQCVILIGGNK